MLFMASAETHNWPESTALQKILAALGRGRPPPIIDRERRFGRPAETRLRRLVARGQHGVDGDVEVSLLHFPADVGMIGETHVGMREVDQVDVPDNRIAVLGRIFWTVPASGSPARAWDELLSPSPPETHPGTCPSP